MRPEAGHLISAELAARQPFRICSNQFRRERERERGKVAAGNRILRRRKGPLRVRGEDTACDTAVPAGRANQLHGARVCLSSVKGRNI